MTKEELYATMSQNLSCPVDDGSTMGNTMGWDSLNHVMMIMSLASQYGVDIPATMLGQLTTAVSLAEFFKDQGLLDA